MAKLKLQWFFLGVVISSLTWIAIIFHLWPDELNVNSNSIRSSKHSVLPAELESDSHSQIMRKKNNLVDKAIQKQLDVKHSKKKVKNKDYFPEEDKLNMIDSSLEKRPKPNKAAKRKSIKLITDDEPNQLEDVQLKEQLLELSMITSEADAQKHAYGQQHYAFNLLVSDRLGNERDIPDTRPKQCSEIVYPQDLPRASLIICFYQEALSALMRTVHSVLNRTPPKMLEEIILIDDFSTDEVLQDRLEREIEEIKNVQVRIIRNKRREGLIRARNIGARAAKGEVLVFLDSHCEVNRDWLQPLVTSLLRGNKTVAVPVIDQIDDTTLEYRASPPVRGGFIWAMHFRWDPMPSDHFSSPGSQARPYKTATMAGGLFAMTRRDFLALGLYDDGMDIWGAENLEMSFRVWMCGGEIKIVPCSRAGHIFRRRRPYGNPGGRDVMTRNNVRLVEVWLDEYKERYYSAVPAARGVTPGDVTARHHLRDSLRCRNFDWYMKNVYPDMDAAFSRGLADARAYDRVAAKGLLQVGDLCLVGNVDKGNGKSKRGTVSLTKCSPKDPLQVWHELGDGSLRLGVSKLCLDTSAATVLLAKCSGSGAAQYWHWAGQHKGWLFNPASGRCLALSGGRALTLDMCRHHPSHNFTFLHKLKV